MAATLDIATVIVAGLATLVGEFDLRLLLAFVRRRIWFFVRTGYTG